MQDNQYDAAYLEKAHRMDVRIGWLSGIGIVALLVAVHFGLI